MPNEDASLAKLLFNDRTRKILNVLSKESLSTKEMAKKIEEPPLNLYHTINKLVELDLIKVDKEVRVNNMIERYYSSKRMVEKDSLVYEGDFIKDHYEVAVKAIMLEVNKAIYQLRNDMDRAESNPKEKPTSSVVFSILEKKLSYQNWEKLNQQIRDFLEDVEEDPDGDNYRFVVTGYKD